MNNAQRAGVLDMQDSEVEASSHFAVIRQKIKLPNDNKHVKAFRSVYDQLFFQFQEQLIEQYRLMKEGYIDDFK